MKVYRQISSRATLLGSAGLIAIVLISGTTAPALAQTQKIRVGLMLPYTGTYAQLGTAITNGFKLAVTEKGGRLGGRELEYFTVDDEAEPAKAPENTNKLVQRDKVDVLVGTVHSGVQTGMVKIARENNTLLIIFPMPDSTRQPEPRSGRGRAMGRRMRRRSSPTSRVRVRS